MRIISGKYKGKQLLAPRNLPVRPTTDFAKEALFNVLQNHFDLSQCNVLDLYAGTGNLSYEFASRGVPQVTAIDAYALCIKFIKQTAEKLDFSSITAIKADAVKFVQRAYQTWDIIVADPPYDYKDYDDLIETVLSKKLLNEDGLLVIEHGKFVSFAEHPHLFDERKYGNVHFSFFQSEVTEEA